MSCRVIKKDDCFIKMADLCLGQLAEIVGGFHKGKIVQRNPDSSPDNAGFIVLGSEYVFPEGEEEEVKILKEGTRIEVNYD